MYDLRRKRNLKEISIIPVMIGATGLMKKNFLVSIPGDPSAREIQTIALKGTVRILKKSSRMESLKCGRMFGIWEGCPISS